MARKINNIIISSKAPNKNDLWVELGSKSQTLKVFNNGWVNIGGKEYNIEDSNITNSNIKNATLNNIYIGSIENSNYFGIINLDKNNAICINSNTKTVVSFRRPSNNTGGIKFGTGTNDYMSDVNLYIEKYYNTGGHIKVYGDDGSYNFELAGIGSVLFEGKSKGTLTIKYGIDGQLSFIKESGGTTEQFVLKNNLPSETSSPS